MTRLGAETVDRLRGMFAFAIWDEEYACSVLATASVSSPSTTPGRATSSVRLGDQGATPSCPRAKRRPGRPRRLSCLPVLPPADVLQGRARTARAIGWMYETGEPCRSGGGRLLGPRLRPHGPDFEERIEALLRDRWPAPTQRRAGRGISDRRSRLQRGGLAGQRPDGEERMKAFTGLFPEDPRYDESQYAREVASFRRTSTFARWRSMFRTFWARLSMWCTTSTTPPRDPVRSRSTWSPRPPHGRARSSSAARAGTRSSAGTPAT